MGIKNIEDKPIIPLPQVLPIPEELYNLFLLDELDFQKDTPYTYNGTIHVPRVSIILKECISKEYLINWAARIGKQQYAIERNKATTIGTRVHEMIENYLLNSLIFSSVPPNFKKFILSNTT